MNNVTKIEKALTYELRRFKVEAMDKIAEDLEDVVRRHISKIFYWRVKELEENRQPGLLPIKDRNGTSISDKEKVKERWVEPFENVLNLDKIRGNDRE